MISGATRATSVASCAPARRWIGKWLIFGMVLILASHACCGDWKKSNAIEGVTEWSSADLKATLRLTKGKNKGGVYYRLDLILKDGQVLDVGMPTSNTWIDNSWAGLAWLPDAEFAWYDDRYIFFQSDFFLAIFDIYERRFIINNQTEFLAKIGDFCWFYVAYRGKNTFSSSDVFGIIGADLLQKASISVPPGFDDVALINRVGRSAIILDGLLIAPPVPGKESVWLLVASNASNVAIQQYKIPSLDRLSSVNVAKSIPDLEKLIKQSRDGGIPKEGVFIINSLVPIKNVTNWFLDSTK